MARRKNRISNFLAVLEHIMCDKFFTFYISFEMRQISNICWLLSGRGPPSHHLSTSFGNVMNVVRMDENKGSHIKLFTFLFIQLKKKCREPRLTILSHEEEMCTRTLWVSVAETDGSRTNLILSWLFSLKNVILVFVRHTTGETWVQSGHNLYLYSP